MQSCPINMMSEASAELRHRWQQRFGVAGAAAEVMIENVLPHLLGLLHEAHDRPALYWRPVVRCLVDEHRFVDDNGDCPSESRLVEAEVSLLLDLLEHLRQRQLERGQWSEQAAAPCYFG